MTGQQVRRRPLAPRTRDAEPRFGIRHWSALGFVLLAVAIIGAGAAIGLAVNGGGAARESLLKHVDPAILDSNRLSDAVSGQAGAVRAYAISVDPNARTDYQRGKAAETTATSAIAGRLADAPRSASARAALTQVTTTMAAWRRDFADPAVAKDGRTDLGGPAGQLGEQRFNAVRAALATERARLGEMQRRAASQLNDQTDRLYMGLISAAIILVVGAIGAAALIRRTVLRPVSELTGKVRQVSQGDFAHPLEVTGPAEIAELAAHVDAMRDHIVEEWREADTARDQLDHQAAELRRSNAELEQFAYVASHDLQEPLRKVASFCQMLDRRYSDVLDERGKQYIDFAVDGAKRMQALISDLLDFSRVGRVDREMVAVKCERVLQSAMDNLGLARSETDAGITWDELPEVNGDPVLLGQLFQNLLGNAIKFRADEPPRVHIGAVERADGMWEFACVDNGIGIDAAYADRIFLIFQRLHPKDEYTGTGIGLALCKKIVEYHGGEIWLDPTPDEPGTTIRWTLPEHRQEEIADDRVQ